MEKRVGEVSRY